jgi:hypothetical protein
VFVTAGFKEGDPLLADDATILKPTEEEKKHVTDFATEVEGIDAALFIKLVAEKKVKFNKVVYDGSQDNYVKKVKREAELSEFTNVSKGGLAAVSNQIDAHIKLATEDYDVLAFVAHGYWEWIDQNAGTWQASGKISVAGDDVEQDKVAKMIAGKTKSITWVSCFKDGKHCEGGSVIPAKGKVGYLKKMVNGKEVGKEACWVNFTPFGFEHDTNIEFTPRNE